MLHETLKEARLNANLTMEEAGKRLDVSQSTLSRIEAGETGVSSQRLVDLASAYGVSPSALLDGSVVRSMSETDLDRMGMVIEFVEETLAEKSPRPSPRQIKNAVVTIFKQETALSWDTGATFDPTRYQDLMALLFE
ncbi:helix-turn-helix transcriptional regulator [Thalassobius sp. I31.1]|uniref:helix-turn-helix domain-containing protein n=1 Tax=Thalassobius sp. I31.1 TaxID=2109912 RepID=UPI000D1A776A|nr:helix-turn-helix transcriptional regulator [Thalassobius sp. I31.1]